MSRSYRWSGDVPPRHLSHHLAHSLLPTEACWSSETAHYRCLSLYDLDDYGINDSAVRAELRRRGWPAHRAASFLLYQQLRYGKEEGSVRRAWRRAARRRSRALLRAERFDEIVEPRHTSGWLTW